jgi:hypothetical protein
MENNKNQKTQEEVVFFEDDLVSYDTAILAKEIGFDIDCGWKLRKLEDGSFTHTNCSELGVEQPTLSLLQKWLREVKGEDIIPPLFFSGLGYACTIIGNEDTIYFKSYQEALENELCERLKKLLT